MYCMFITVFKGWNLTFTSAYVPIYNIRVSFQFLSKVLIQIQTFGVLTSINTHSICYNFLLSNSLVLAKLSFQLLSELLAARLNKLIEQVKLKEFEYYVLVNCIIIQLWTCRGLSKPLLNSVTLCDHLYALESENG